MVLLHPRAGAAGFRHCPARPVAPSPAAGGRAAVHGRGRSPVPDRGLGHRSGVDAAGSDQVAAALDALARRADWIRLPPPALPGWSSFCAHEYSAIVIELAAEVGALRVALATAARRAAP